jgi:hypothetical protein
MPRSALGYRESAILALSLAFFKSEFEELGVSRQLAFLDK